MIERLTVLMFTITIAACASSGPETASSAQGEAAEAEQVAAAESDGGLESADAAQAEQVAAVAEEPEDEIICRREKQAGTNLRKKVCFRRSALDGRAAQDQEALRQMRSLSPSSTQEFGSQ